ncbi:MAG: AAA family ATPase [Candidatus Moranbacteria bacterium]|nr:AAA family ATPase [Candidatus Moranbacteria bacterium]
MKKILGLAGEIASGKGTVAKYIVDKHNGSAHRFSGILRDLAGRLYLEENRDNLQKMSTAAREYFGQDILCKTIYHDVLEDKHKRIAIDGVRRFQDVEKLKEIPGFYLVYIEADLETRFQRLRNRDENTDDKGKILEEFKQDGQKEAELQIKDLKKRADVVVDNSGSFEDLYSQLDKIL